MAATATNNRDTIGVKEVSSSDTPPKQQTPERQNNFGGRNCGAGNSRLGHGNLNYTQNKSTGGSKKRAFGTNQQGGEIDRHERSGGERDRGNMRNQQDKFLDKIAQMSGPTYDIPAFNNMEKKFSGRNRLYIGNIGNDVTEDDVCDLFKPYGQVSEVFVNKDKNFAFIKLDFHSNAEKAKRELDGAVLKNRNLKIRFAPNSSTIKVLNLSYFVSNELLHLAFSVFGEIERAIICVDERGKPTGVGIVEYSRKCSALYAIRKCKEHCYFLTGALRPCIVESYDVVDDNDGYSDKNIPKKNSEYLKEREVGPRFANPGSFENEYGIRWKQLHDLYTQKEAALKKELDIEKEKLEAQMELARYEHETEMLREQLRVREMDRERQKREWEMKERQAEEERQRMEEKMRRQQDEIEARMHRQDEEMRRRQQENTLFMQAHNLDNMLEQQEQAYDQPPPFNNITNDTNVIEPKPFISSYERSLRFGRDSLDSRTGHWINENRRDDFPNKRRRF